MVDKPNNDVILEEDEEKAEGGEVLVVTERKPDEHDEDDERLSADQRDDESDEDWKARRDKRQKMKERRKHAKERSKEEIDLLRRQNDELAQRLAALEGRTVQQDASLIDQRLNETMRHVQNAENILAEAVKRGDGAKVAEAMRYRDQAISQAQQLNAVKQQAVRQPQQPQGIDPSIKRLADDWMSDNKWYDPKGRDEDSRIVLAIDETLAREGYRPDTPEYWDELQERVERRLPHKFGSSDSKPAQRKGPPIGGSREHAPPSTRKEIYISPERKQALVEAGYWDDPEKRARAIKQMASWDRQNVAKR